MQNCERYSLETTAPASCVILLRNLWEKAPFSYELTRDKLFGKRTGEENDRVAKSSHFKFKPFEESIMSLYKFVVTISALLWVISGTLEAETITSRLGYTYPVDRLKWGHSLGNRVTYATLTGKTDVVDERGTVRRGLRESTNQQYYLLGWNISLKSTEGNAFLVTDTRFFPVYQESLLKLGDLQASKIFFLPFENNYLRSAHFLFEVPGEPKAPLVIHSQVSLPQNVRVAQAEYKGHKYLELTYPDKTVAAFWGTGDIRTHRVSPLDADSKEQEIQLEFDAEWSSSHGNAQSALSFAYSLYGASRGNPLNAFFDIYATDAGTPSSTLGRVKLLLEESTIAMRRYLGTCHLWTPDPVINRGVQWAKVNQLRDQQEYKWGDAFSNNPPSDIVVGRDSVWYLAGSAYYAQLWSRKLLDFWFRYGLEVNGKFTEYLTASGDPIFKDDYGLNINDNTPLFLMAAHQYYSVTGDLGFLYSVYPKLLQSADYILEQRKAGLNNRYGLVWSTSTETFVRGLCGWRNAIPNYTLSGAVTEVNAECYRALMTTAELAKAMGDEPNRQRLQSAAGELARAIDKYLRSNSEGNPYYYLTIEPSGKPVDDVTGDLLFPVLYGVSPQGVSQQILTELFSERFWANASNGAGGIRTVSAAQKGYQAKATPQNYGLLGGVWPNLALWVAKAAADQGFPDLCLKGLRGTWLRTERDDPARYNVVPAELPEYFNGDDLVQIGQPRSTFLHGIYIWAAVEGLLGLSPHPDVLQVNPSLPPGWNWIAVSQLPYRGFPLTLFADRQTKTLFTTVRVETSWNQVEVQERLQHEYSFQSEQNAFWMVISSQNGKEILAASDQPVHGRLVEQKTGHVAAELTIPAGGMVRKKLESN
jgi:glycogen debranching enzyme